MENIKLIAFAIMVAFVSTVGSEIAFGNEVNMTLVEESTDQINTIINQMVLLGADKQQEYSGLGE